MTINYQQLQVQVNLWSVLQMDPVLVSRHIGVVLNPEAGHHLVYQLLLTTRFNLAKRILVKKDDGLFVTLQMAF